MKSSVTQMNWDSKNSTSKDKKRNPLTTTSALRSHFIYPGLFLTLVGLGDDMHGDINYKLRDNH